MHVRLEICTTPRRGQVAGMNGVAVASLVVAGGALAWAVYRDQARRRALAAQRHASARGTDEQKVAGTREAERRREEAAMSRRGPRVGERRLSRARLVAVSTG